MRHIRKTKKRHNKKTKKTKKTKRSIRRVNKKTHKSRKMRKMRGGDYDSHIPENSNAVMIVKQDGMFIPMSQDLYKSQYKQQDVEKDD